LLNLSKISGRRKVLMDLEDRCFQIILGMAELDVIVSFLYLNDTVTKIWNLKSEEKDSLAS